VFHFPAHKKSEKHSYFSLNPQSIEKINKKKKKKFVGEEAEQWRKKNDRSFQIW